MRQNKLYKLIKRIFCITLVIVMLALFFPTWTPKVSGDNSIGQLRHIEINGTRHSVMITGQNIANPVIIFVHGGPGCSEIPYVRKYQDLLEKDFTIVHYDQRASGKSYHFFEDYSKLSADVLVDDLLELTDYISTLLEKQKVILIGHSYGTYIATKATAKAPEKYTAYIGIGQMSNLVESELDSLDFCISEAHIANNLVDYDYLKGLTDKISSGEMLTPRSYVRKYRGASRLIDDNADYLKGFLLGSEYNLMDVIRYSLGILYSQDILINQAYLEPLPEIVKSLNLPFYFVMGKYDYMTSAAAAKKYFDTIKTNANKEFIVFDHSAHYPQFEEKEKFYNWMKDMFAE